MKRIRYEAKEQLKAARLALKLSQRDVAMLVTSHFKDLELPEPTYNKIEAGKLTVSTDMAVAITRTLEKNIWEVFGVPGGELIELKTEAV